MDVFNPGDQVFLQVKRYQLHISFKTFDLFYSVSFKVQTFKFREQVHVFNPFEAFVVEVKLFVKFECPIVKFPFFFEKVQNPLLGAAGSACVLTILVFAVAYAVSVVFSIHK